MSVRWAVDCAWVESAWRAAVADGPCAVELRWVTPEIEFVHRGTADFAAGTARLVLSAAAVGEGEETRFLDDDREYRLGDDGRWRETHSSRQSRGGPPLVGECCGLLPLLRTASEPLPGDGRPHAASWRLDSGALPAAASPSFAAFGFPLLGADGEWRGSAAADDLGRLVHVRVWAHEPVGGWLQASLATALEARLSTFGDVTVERPDRIVERQGGLLRRVFGVRGS